MRFWRGEEASGGEDGSGRGLEGVVLVVGGGWDGVADDEEEGGLEEGLLMEREREAGGPTGTMREPNSTPIVTSWWGEKRPSQRRMVSCKRGRERD